MRSWPAESGASDVRRFRRPSRPANFAALAATHAASIASFVTAAGPAALTNAHFPELWSHYKSHFIRAQRGRCAYCERSISDTGHIDHYAPKSAVGQLIAPGRELADAFNVRGRVVHDSRPGYWWLAYDWRNWLLTCERCYSAWKRTFFPVGTRRPPKQGQRERRLLLSPFGREDPVRHLRFDRLGQVAPRAGSTRGRATIDTCGLDRESLRSARHEAATTAHILCDRVLDAVSKRDATRRREACGDLARMASPNASHSGMVAAIVLSELNIDLAGLVALREQP